MHFYVDTDVAGKGETSFLRFTEVYNVKHILQLHSECLAHSLAVLRQLHIQWRAPRGRGLSLY